MGKILTHISTVHFCENHSSVNRFKRAILGATSKAKRLYLRCLRQECEELKIIQTKSSRASAASRRSSVLSMNNSIGGYSINGSHKLRTIILPTQVLQDNNGNELLIYIGTSSNVETQAAFISITREDLTGSALFIVEGSNTTLLSTNFLIGNQFNKNLKASKSIKRFIPNSKKHVLVVLTTYWPITCCEEIIVKGKASDTTHNLFRKLGNDAYAWMSIMTKTMPGAAKNQC